jgi:hypothetical protein
MKLRRLLRSTLSVVLAASFLSAISIESASAAAACSPTSITANNFTYLYFKTATTCDWTVPAGVTKVDALIVGGGGSGGIGGGLANEPGGGGAGGFIENLAVAVTPGSVNSIVVGAGAAGATTASNGGDSSALSYTAKGGGAGATNGGVGANGGSGGGGSHNATAGGTATSGQGNNGGAGGGSIGGGGGGAGSAGSSFNGGFGKQSVITSLYYAGGGAAIRTAVSTAAGVAYHGGGVPTTTINGAKGSAQDGVANTGSGGAGGFSNASAVTPNNGAGGSGIVVIRYYTAVETFSAIDTVTVNVTNAFVPLTTSATSIDAAGFTGNVAAAIRTTNALFKIGATAAGNVTANTGYSSSQFTSGTDTETAFYGTLAQVNAALDTISVSVSGANAKIQIAVFPAGYAYNFDNGHLYKMFIGAYGVYWEYARCAALFDTSTTTNTTSSATDCMYSGSAPTQRSVLGLSGYLSNITSASEVNFALNKGGIAQLTLNAWLGGSDTSTAPVSTTEGNFIWMDGPESRKKFFVAPTSASAPANCSAGLIGVCSYGDSGYNYNNWANTEPNNAGGNESYLQIYVSGLWNDCANTCTVPNYLVEYGNTGESLYTQDSIALPIATAAPVISLPGNATTANKLIQTTITASVQAPGTVSFYYKGQVIGKCKNKSVTGTAPNLSYGCVWKPVIQGQQVISVAYTPTDSANLSPATSNLTILVGKRTGAR